MTTRVFVDPGTIATGNEMSLSNEESHYLSRVRRAAMGDQIEVLDGEGAIFRGEVTSNHVTSARVRICEPVAQGEARPLELGLGYPDPSDTLEAIRGAAEMGATQIVLCKCERSHQAVPGEGRIERVLRAAQRQCGRPSPPIVRGPIPLEAWLAEPSPLPGFFAWARMRGEPRSSLTAPAGARLLVGPEGGLTDSEVAIARAAGLQALALGPWVLPTPTAVIAGLARLIEGC